MKPALQYPLLIISIHGPIAIQNENDECNEQCNGSAMQKMQRRAEDAERRR